MGDVISYEKRQEEGGCLIHLILLDNIGLAIIKPFKYKHLEEISMTWLAFRSRIHKMPQSAEKHLRLK
jgi:hypothetical protein